MLQPPIHAPPEGGLRWTRSGAAFVLTVEGRVMRLQLSSPLVPVGGPQTVEFWLDGEPAGRLTLDSTAVRVAEIPVSRPPGSQVVLRLRTAYTIVPARRGIYQDPRRLGVRVSAVQWAGG